jgi:ferritin
MLSEKMSTALNTQVNKEMFSAYLYLAMAARSAELGFKGFASWFTVQYHEEMFHAMKLFRFIQDRGAQVRLAAIEEPKGDFSSPIAMFKKTAEHERTVTKSIEELYALAAAERDYASQTLLQWYVMEQVEEEKNDAEILQALEMTGGNPAGLMFVDRDLGARKVSIPTDFTGGLGGGD